MHGKEDASADGGPALSDRNVDGPDGVVEDAGAVLGELVSVGALLKKGGLIHIDREAELMRCRVGLHRRPIDFHAVISRAHADVDEGVLGDGSPGNEAHVFHVEVDGAALNRMDGGEGDFGSIVGDGLRVGEKRETETETQAAGGRCESPQASFLSRPNIAVKARFSPEGAEPDSSPDQPTIQHRQLRSSFCGRSHCEPSMLLRRFDDGDPGRAL